MKKTAIVITPMCPHSRKFYGIRLELREKTWVRTWAFPIKPSTMKSEDFHSKMDLSNMCDDETYKGCPYCKGKMLMQCGNCGKIYCYTGETGTSTCPWCKNVGTISEGGWNSVSGGGL